MFKNSQGLVGMFANLPKQPSQSGLFGSSVQNQGQSSQKIPSFLKKNSHHKGSGLFSDLNPLETSKATPSTFKVQGGLFGGLYDGLSNTTSVPKILGTFGAIG